METDLPQCAQATIGKFYPSVVVCAVTMETDPPQFAHACRSMKQRPCNLTTGVYVWISEIRTDRVTHPVERELKEQGCNTKLERRRCGVLTPIRRCVTT